MMKQILRRLWAGLLCLVLLSSLLSLPTSAVEETVDVEYLGRGFLQQLPNADALLYAYDCIAAGVENCIEQIDVYNGTDPVTKEEMRMVYETYRRDHAAHFWLDNPYTFYSNAQTVTAIKVSYLGISASLTEYRARFLAAAEEILQGLRADMSDFEKELYLHDALAQRVDYTEAANAHNAYGALVEGRAVCEGYAEALQFLLQCAGIDSFIVLGTSVNPATQEEEGHAWNLVRVDGAYYHVDLTWNDQGERLFHAYFNCTDAVIGRDHRVNETAYTLPACTSTDAHYFNVYADAQVTKPYSVEQISNLLSASPRNAHVYLAEDAEDFYPWFQENILKIVTRMGIVGAFSYGYTALANEYILKINTCLHASVSFVIAAPATCTEDGNIAHYVCNTCGERFSDSGINYPLSGGVTVFATGHTWTKEVKNEQTLRKKAETCQENTTYWYSCTVCDAIGDSEYFTDEETGAHAFSTLAHDETHHFKVCGCGERERVEAHGDDDANGVCDICSRNLSATQENPSGKDPSSAPSGEGMEALKSLWNSDTGKLVLIASAVALVLLVILGVAVKRR